MEKKVRRTIIKGERSISLRETSTWNMYKKKSMTKFTEYIFTTQKQLWISSYDKFYATLQLCCCESTGRLQIKLFLRTNSVTAIKNIVNRCRKETL